MLENTAGPGTAPKKCPHCHAIGTVVLDHTLGDASCTRCATVVLLGIEDPDGETNNPEQQQQLHAKHAMGTVGTAGRGVGAIDGLTWQVPAVRLNRGQDDWLRRVLVDCRCHQQRWAERVMCPDVVTETGLSLARAMFLLGFSRSLPLVGRQHDTLFAATFMIAAAWHRYPIPAGEIECYEEEDTTQFVNLLAADGNPGQGQPGPDGVVVGGPSDRFSAARIDRRVTDVVAGLQLEAQMLVLSSREHTDLARLYLMRCRYSLSQYHAAVAAVGKAIAPAARRPVPTSVAIAAAVILCVSNSAISAGMQWPLPVVTAGAAEEDVAFAARMHHNPQPIRDVLDAVMSSDDGLQMCVNAARGVA